MLVEFSLSNFRSIHERQTLSMAAAAVNEHRGTHVAAATAPATPDLLRSAVLYGPNAAGKSNLILALKFIHDFVLDSARKGQKNDAIPVTPFAMAEEAANEPSEFELVFVEGGVRYQYGFAVTRERVEREWLTAWPKGSPQRWLNRSADSNDWEFGPNFHGQRKLWQEATRDNALFLSTAVQLNAKQLTPVFDWIEKRLQVITPFARIDPGFSVMQSEQRAPLRRQMLQLLAMADLGIDDIKVEYRKFDPTTLPEDFPEELRQRFLADVADREFPEVQFMHHRKSGSSIPLDLDDESGGTQKLFALAGPWLDVLTNGLVLVIDELDTSLHPVLLRRMLEMFHDPKINTRGAQLIFSTHDTNMLDNQLFRRDQIWFVEKDKMQQTHLYPLTEFSPRKGENFERGYLQGRYGALPFIGELRA